MTCKEIIKKRKSAFQFSDQKIDYADVLDILDSARLAPSSKNRQPWSFYILTGDEKEKIREWLLDELARTNSEATGVATAKYIHDCQYVILVFMEEGTDFITNYTNILSIGASIENALLTATEKGIASLWICDLCAINKRLVEYCNATGRLISSICLGIDTDPTMRIAKKKALDTIILNNKK